VQRCKHKNFLLQVHCSYWPMVGRNDSTERQYRSWKQLFRFLAPLRGKGSLTVLRYEIRRVLSRYTLRMHIKCDFPHFTQLTPSFIHILATDSQSIVTAKHQARSTLTYRLSTLSSASDLISFKRVKDYTIVIPTKCTSFLLLKAQHTTICTFVFVFLAPTCFNPRGSSSGGAMPVPS
jgi:hypothetical protein